jgi:hypothetical protein
MTLGMATEPGRLYPVRRLAGAPVCATDGGIGRIETFLFDDDRWTVRYVVVDTGGWLAGRRALVSPAHCGRFDWGWTAGALRVDLSRAQIERAPEPPADEPISRRHESALNVYYGLVDYWCGPMPWGAYPYPAGLALPALAVTPPSADTRGDHVRVHRVDELLGARVIAMDGDAGSALDVLVDDVAWSLHFVHVTMRDGRRVLVPLDLVRSVEWSPPTLHLAATRDRVAASPDYDGTASPGPSLGGSDEDARGRRVP